MSACLVILGVVPNDADWKRMKNVYDACKDAGVSVPDEVEKFFDYTKPDESGAIIQFREWEDESSKSSPHVAITKWRAECSDGYEIDLSKLPTKVKLLRCYISY